MVILSWQNATYMTKSMWQKSEKLFPTFPGERKVNIESGKLSFVCQWFDHENYLTQ